MTSGARHVLTILAVDDLPRARSFYERAFGWERIVDVPVYVEHALPGGMRLGLYARGGFAHNTGQMPARAPAGEITATEVYLWTDDLDAAIARMTEAGARVLSPRAPRDWGDEEPRTRRELCWQYFTYRNLSFSTATGWCGYLDRHLPDGPCRPDPPAP